jgi:ABC-2 type transport system permease protein
MKMNIYKQEFKMHLMSVVTWSLSLTLVIFVYLSLFTSVAPNAVRLNETLANFPEELLMAFGMDTMDLSSVLGFYGVIFLICQICLAIQASNYGFSILSVEERDLTADFLLAKPIGRNKIVTSKLLSALTGLTITNAFIWISSFIAIDLNRDGRPYDRDALILLLLSIIVFQLFFLTLGMLISMLVKKVRSVTPFSMALAFGMYVLSAFGSMLGDTKLELITPFTHFEPNAILSNGEYNLPLVLISVSVIVISMIGSYVLYDKRNMAAAI